MPRANGNGNAVPPLGSDPVIDQLRARVPEFAGLSDLEIRRRAGVPDPLPAPRPLPPPQNPPVLPPFRPGLLPPRGLTEEPRLPGVPPRWWEGQYEPNPYEGGLEGHVTFPLWPRG